MNISGIYGWYCTASDKWYVGQSKKISIRRNQHASDLKKGRAHNPHLQSAWILYGQERFEFHILEELQEELLDQAECWWISYYSSNHKRYGYNCDTGGNARRIVSTETRQKISRSKLGKKGTPHTEESKNRLSLSAKNNPARMQQVRQLGIDNKGNRCSDRQRRQISEANHGRKHTQDTKLKMSRSKLGVPKSLLMRQRLSAARTGQHHSTEARQKMSQSAQLRWAKQKSHQATPQPTLQ